MTAKKLNALIVEDHRGEKIIFDEDGKEIVNLTKYHEMSELLYNLTNGTCPEENALAKALYSWATVLSGYDQTPSWDTHFELIEDRSIYRPKLPPKKVDEDEINSPF